MSPAQLSHPSRTRDAAVDGCCTQPLCVAIERRALPIQPPRVGSAALSEIDAKRLRFT